MFYIDSRDELKLPRFPGHPSTEKAFRMVALPVVCCYFLLEVTQELDKEGSFGHHYFLASVLDLVDMCGHLPDGCSVSRVDLMSPGHVRGEEGYRLERIIEIWRDTNATRTYAYKLFDGSTVEDDWGEERSASPKFELMMSFCNAA